MNNQLDDLMKKIKYIKGKIENGKQADASSFINDLAFDAAEDINAQNIKSFKHSKLIDDFTKIQQEAYMKQHIKFQQIQGKKE